MEKLSKQIQKLKYEIEELEKNIEAKAAEDAMALVRMQAKIFLEMIFAPYMDGICDVWGVSPEEGLHILIDKNATIDKIAKDNPEALAELMNQRELKMIFDVASPLRDVSDDWIKEKMGILFDVMAELRPELARGITEAPGGTEWFYDSLTGLQKMFFGKPQINIEAQ